MSFTGVGSGSQDQDTVDDFHCCLSARFFLYDVAEGSRFHSHFGRIKLYLMLAGMILLYQSDKLAKDGGMFVGGRYLRQRFSLTELCEPL